MTLYSAVVVYWQCTMHACKVQITSSGFICPPTLINLWQQYITLTVEWCSVRIADYWNLTTELQTHSLNIRSESVTEYAHMYVCVRYKYAHAYLQYICIWTCVCIHVYVHMYEWLMHTEWYIHENSMGHGCLSIIPSGCFALVGLQQCSTSSWFDRYDSCRAH